MGKSNSNKKDEAPAGEPKEETPLNPENKGVPASNQGNELEMKNWESFHASPLPFEEKLQALRGNNALLFSDHQSIQTQESLWLSIIPQDWKAKILSEYQDNVGKIEEIENFLRPMLVSRIESDVDDFISSWNSKGTTKNLETKKILKVFCFTRKDLVYQRAFAHFSAFFAHSFPEDYAYLYLVYLVKFLFPKDYFSPSNYFLAQNVELGVLAKVLEGFNPTLKQILTAKGKVKVEEKKEGEEKKSEMPKMNDEENWDSSAYRGFVHHIGRVYLTQLCSTMITIPSFGKLIDVMMVHGFNIMHHLALKCLLKCDSKIIYNIKKNLRGKSLSPQNLQFAAINASAEIKKQLAHPLFLQALSQAFTHQPFTDALRRYETFAASAKLEEAVDINDIVEKRIHEYQDILNLLANQDMELDDDVYEGILKFLKVCKSKAKSLNGFLDYETFKKKMENKWTFNPLIAFIIASDPWNTGYVNYYAFELNLTLLSTLPLPQKYTKWCNFYFDNDNSNFEFSDAAQMFTTWDYYLLGVAQCGSDRGLEKVLENKYPEQTNVSCTEIVEFVSTSCSDMKPFCELVKAVTSHISVKEEKSVTYDNGNTNSFTTPNLSFTKNLVDKFPGPDTNDKLFQSDDGGFGSPLLISASKISRSCPDPLKKFCVIF